MADCQLPSCDGSLMDTSDAGAEWPYSDVPLYLVNVVCAAIDVEFMRRAPHIYRAICGRLAGCVVCNTPCATCTLCGTTVCPAHMASHREVSCRMFVQLPEVARTDDTFSIDTLAVILRENAPPEHPPGAPLCASGDPMRDHQTATNFLCQAHEIMCSVFPTLATDAGNTVDSDTGVRAICQCAAGLGTFATLVAARSQRGARCVALGASLTADTCCPINLATVVPPTSNRSWHLLQKTYNNPNKAQCPPCVNGSRCVGNFIKTVDNVEFGRCLPAMRSPHAELAEEPSTEPGLCILCMTQLIAADPATAFLWRDPDGMYLKAYCITRGTSSIVGPHFTKMRVCHYQVTLHSQDTLAIANPRFFYCY